MTNRQKLFVEVYLSNLNATQAAIKAGYSPKTAYSIGQENLKKPEIKRAIQKAMNEQENKLIADRKERQQFWTAVMRNEAEDMKNRLRSSELLAKAGGDFIEKFQADIHEKISSDYDLSLLSESELVQLKTLLLKALPPQGERG